MTIVELTSSVSVKKDEGDIEVHHGAASVHLSAFETGGHVKTSDGALDLDLIDAAATWEPGNGDVFQYYGGTLEEVNAYLAALNIRH